MPSQTFSHTALAAAEPTEVWATFDNPTTWESIGGIDRVYDARVSPTGQLEGFSFDTEIAGKKYVGTATPGERVEGSVITWKVSNSEIKGTIRVQLAEITPGTNIRVTLEVESASFIAGMFFPVIANTIGSGLPATVDDFAEGFGDISPGGLRCRSS